MVATGGGDVIFHNYAEANDGLDHISRIINELEGTQVRIKIIPDMYDILSGSVKMTSIFGAPLHTVAEEELAAFAAAMLASEGAGRSFSQALRLDETVIEPRREWVARYDALYAHWQEQNKAG